MSHDNDAPILEARGIIKRFGALLANDVEAFGVRAGEVIALLGENGAGKSTLAKILYGYYAADAGEIFVGGRRVAIASPRDARALGIGMVFQMFTLIPAMSVYENVALFLRNLPAVPRRAEILAQMRHYADRFHLSFDPWLPVRQLAVGEQQKVEILKQLLAHARILILDEPTKVLAPQESEGLFATIAELRAEGFGIVLITHKLREVLACADRIAVMRQGRVTGLLERSETTEEKLLTLMFGQPVAAPSPAEPTRRAINDDAPPTLELDGVSTSGSGISLNHLSLKVRAGEIVGVAGVSGNGQRELADLIVGVRLPRVGRKLLWGQDASRWSIAEVREKGVAAIPDDPLTLACVPGMSVRENLALGTGRRYRTWLGVDWPKLDADMQRVFGRLGFSRPPFAAPIATLSGGNLQRAILVREFADAPRLIVALYPTRGLDARSTSAVHTLLRNARDGGAGILMVSEDLDELFAISDRLLVLYRGGIAAEFQPENFRAASVGPFMVGANTHANAA
jgi:general nucleoside transport system ATP-binding protein